MRVHVKHKHSGYALNLDKTFFLFWFFADQFLFPISKVKCYADNLRGCERCFNWLARWWLRWIVVAGSRSHTYTYTHIQLIMCSVYSNGDALWHEWLWFAFCYGAEIGLFRCVLLRRNSSEASETRTKYLFLLILLSFCRYMSIV